MGVAGDPSTPPQAWESWSHHLSAHWWHGQGRNVPHAHHPLQATGSRRAGSKCLRAGEMALPSPAAVLGRPDPAFLLCITVELCLVTQAWINQPCRREESLLCILLAAALNAPSQGWARHLTQVVWVQASWWVDHLRYLSRLHSRFCICSPQYLPH